MSRYSRHGGETKVYVGNLGTGAGKGELERAFGYYGPLRTVWIARNPPGFAFVEFEDPRDAEDAVRGLDGKVICGTRVRVELSTGMPRRSRYDRPPTRRPFDPNDRCYECGEKGHYAYDCHRYSRRRRSRSCSKDVLFLPLLPSMLPSLLPSGCWQVSFSLSLTLSREEVFSFPLPQPKQGQEVEILLSSALSLRLSSKVEVRYAQEVLVGRNIHSSQINVVGLDQDPGHVLAPPPAQGADQAQLGDLGLALQLGAGPNLELLLRNKADPNLEVLVEAKAREETTKPPAVFLFIYLPVFPLSFFWSTSVWK
ncbi:hypothetical protein NFI96_025315 [Prochilodus magdalenae]|nr:hypothetical protein NFI96_025315 [Prochilodus magdalenae]